MSIEIINADCRDALRAMPAASVHCCVTSPPYFGLRDYGVDGQIGLEQTPDAFVAEMVAVFREVRRVLRDDGTLWLNLGDSYAGSGRGCGSQYSAARRHRPWPLAVMERHPRSQKLGAASRPRRRAGARGDLRYVTISKIVETL